MKRSLLKCIGTAALLAFATTCAAQRPQWIPTGDLNTPRWDHTATLMPDGKVLVAGGGQGRHAERSAELFDPHTGAWSHTGEMLLGRRGHTATLLPDGRVLVVGGDALGLPGAITTAEVYDPQTQTWSLTGNLNTARVVFTATLLRSGEVLVAGGVDSADETLRSAELYDPATGSWGFTGSLGWARYAHTATALLDGRVLIAAGIDDDFFGTTISRAELYDPESRSWQPAGDLRDTRVSHRATLMPDGKVLVTGGYTRHGPAPPGRYFVEFTLNSGEVYDPVTGQWSVAPDFLTDRAGHTATRLRHGRVLVLGGSRTLGQIPSLTSEPVGSSEVLEGDPAAWVETSPLNTVRGGHTATLLADGSVLVAGGGRFTSGGAIALRSTERLPPMPCDKNHFILTEHCKVDADDGVSATSGKGVVSGR